MITKELWLFPVPSNCIRNGVKLIHEKGDALLMFDYFDENRNDETFTGSLIFESTISHKHTSEKFLRTIGGAYDTLIEVCDSEWIAELSKISPEWAEVWKPRHYAIFLDGYGLYEFLAKDYKHIPEKRGSLEG